MIRILICFIFFTTNLWSNSQELDTFFYAAKNQDFEKAKNIASQLKDVELRTLLLQLSEILSERTKTEIHLTNEVGNDNQRFIKLLILGYQNQYASKRNSLEAYKKFSEALKLSEEMGKRSLIKASLIAMLDLFGSEIFIGSKQYEPFLDRFFEVKSDLTDEALNIMYNLVFFSKADDNVNDVDARYYNYIEKLDSVFTKFPKTHGLFSKYYYEKGMYYKIEEDNEKAEDFFLKADSLAALNPGLKHLRSVNAWQIAAINFQNNNLKKAKQYLKVSQGLSRKLRDTFYLTRLKSLIFQKEGNHDSAYYYLRKSVDVEYQLGYKNNTLESSILTVQNQTDKLKLDKLELDAQNRKSRNWVTALGLLLVFGTAIGFLIHSNTKRKQLMAEQQKVLQEQKVATLLKEQELTTIDAMIEGQEKERQRIANDLHDDLGGLMANVKLHFNSLQQKNTDKNELFGKTNDLLDEAYNKIRAIAHAKNSGVIAKQGLLKAVEQMAQKVSTANSITIAVKDFGLDNRLENSLEITLFRIIQELITNMIKHANATHANIHLTNHGDSLNILVEDNGIGFNSSNKTNAISNGMGLKSIDKRVAHLEGTLHIESELGKGATIIIDIPL